MMNERNIALRMADANRNRVMEGLRTLEDIARFSDQGSLQGRFKSVRHSLQQVFDRWDSADLLATRDAQQDAGRTEKQAAELLRDGGLIEIAASAAGRCEQGLRVLEEAAKFLYPSTAIAIEALRYRIYDLDAELQLMLLRDKAFLEQAQLYVLVDCQLPLPEFVQRVLDLSSAGVDLIQIRDKSAEPVSLIRYADAAVDSLDHNQTRVIMNDRADVASCSRSWGCHVGQEDLSPACTRRILRGEQVLGVSTHDSLQIEKAIEKRADYIGCGPTFPSSTKSFDRFAGLSFLSQAAEFLREKDRKLPAFAIGGINVNNLPSVLEVGFDRIAVSSCVWNAEEPAVVAASLKELLLAKRGGRTV